jgi:DNA invertase Pin-like site-specific DNA recombinase
MDNPTMAVIYCRTACSPGMEKDAALQAQEEECRAYAKARGIKIKGVFYDPGISGLTADRPGWRAMMKVLKNASAPHGVLIRDIMRLARDFAVSDKLEAECNRLGHEIVVADENYPCAYEPILPRIMQNFVRLLKKHEDHLQ